MPTRTSAFRLGTGSVPRFGVSVRGFPRRRATSKVISIRGVRHKLLIFNYFKHVFEYRECNKWQRLLRTGFGGVAVESSL